MLDRITNAIGGLAALAFEQIMRIPRPVRLVIRDCLEGAAVALTSVTLFVPETKEDAKRLAITISIAVGAAVLAVLRRRVWEAVLDRLGGGEEE